MGILTAPELRPLQDLTPLQRARDRHDEVLRICDHLVQALHAWGRLGRLCLLVERDRDWELLGYESFGRWMMAVEEHTGYSRAAAYSYMKLFREVSPNGGEHVLEMSLGTAQVFRQLPAVVQRDPDVRSAAKKLKPKEFRQKIAKDHPSAHVELKEQVCLNLDASFIPIFHEIIESMRLLAEEELSYESCVELAFIAWSNEAYGESEAGITNLARARQIREMANGG